MKKFLSITIAVLILATGSLTLLGQTADKLASGTFIVYARSPQAWRFNVDTKTMANATVSGRFSVTDGIAPAGVDFFVFNEENYIKWRSEDDAVKAQAKPLYSFGRKTEGDVSFKIADPGIYYVTFSNLFSYEGRKTVNADIKLQYDKR
jgi:hypothetical protein